MNNIKKIELYVAPNGNDSNEGSIDKPLKTLGAAKDKVKELHTDPNVPVTVYFRGGEYSAKDNQAVFTDEDSGTENAPITYCAYNGEKPVFDCGIKLDMSHAVKVTDESVKSRIIDDAAREGLYQLDISEYADQMPLPKNSNYKISTTLYRKGKPMYFSRWPSMLHEAEFSTEETWMYTPHIQHDDPEKMCPFHMYVDYAVMDHIKRFWSEEARKNVWVSGYLWHNWNHCNYHVADFDFDDNAVIVTEHEGSYRCNPEPSYKYRRYYFHNILEEISGHYEFFIDYEKKLLYFYPENENDQIILAAEDHPVFTFTKNVSNIIIDGLEFEYFRSNSIKGGQQCNHITVQNCTVSKGCEDGITFANCSDIKILNNHIYYMGASGVIIYGAGDAKTFTPGNILIEGNEIHDIGIRKATHGVSAYVWATVGAVIRRNKLYNHHQTTLFVDGIDTTVEYNEIFDVVKDTDDASAIYWGRTASIIGMRVRYNYLHDIGQNNTSTWAIDAVYSDDLSTSGEIYGNLFINSAIFGDDNTYKQNPRTNPTIQLNGAQFAYVHDNIFLASTPREKPISDVRPRETKEWLKCTLGAYVPGNRNIQGWQWKEGLQGLGVFEEDGMTPSKRWIEHYKGTCWEDMFKLLSKENFIAGAKDADGNTYGIPDIRKKFQNNEITEDEAREMFDNYAIEVMKQYGEDYVTNRFERNIVIGTNPEFMDENGVKFEYLHPVDNIYLTKEEAASYFVDMANDNYALSETGKAKVSKIISDFSCLANKQEIENA